MELGYGKLRRNNTNTLQYSVHPDLGLVWGDGQSLLLTPLTHVDGQLTCSDPVSLRKLEKVETAAWSAEVSKNRRYLAVSTGETVSVWLVKGTEATDLTLKQVTKLDISSLPQGLLWHPTKDILCILAKDKIVTIPDQQGSSKPVVLNISNRGHICSGVWMTDDDSPCLLVALKRKTTVDFMVFHQWDTETTPNLADARVITMETSVTIRSMTSVGNNLVAMTADLPLETLCCQGDMFDISDAIFKPIHNLETTEEHTGSGDNLSNVATEKSGPIDLTALCATRRSTAATPLLFRQLPRPVVKETAELILFQVDSTDIRELCWEGLPGIITPDLIAADPGSGHITVGSNTVDTLQVFSVQGTTLEKLVEINLKDGEKAKGIHMPGQGFVIAMVGKSMEENFSALLPTSAQEMYQLRLRCFEIKDHQKTAQKGVEKEELSQLRLPNGGALPTLVACSQGPHKAKTHASHTHHSKQSHLVQDVTGNSQEMSPRERALSDTRRNTRCKSQTSECREAEDLPAQDLTTGLRSPEEFSEGKEAARNTEHQSISSPFSETNSQPLPDLKETLLTIESLEEEMNQQMKRIARIKESILAYSRIFQSSRNVPRHPDYPTLDNAEVVHVTYEDLNLSETIVKTFLLDEGMLKLETLQEVFGLKTVELCCKGDYVVVAANKEGYIPVRFVAGSSITIRGNKS